MRIILILLFLIPNITEATPTKVVWGKLQKVKKNQKVIILSADDDYYYLLQSKGEKKYLKKIDPITSITIDSFRVAKKINGLEYSIYKAIHFGSKLWVLSMSYEEKLEKGIFWIQPVLSNPFSLGSPIQISHFFRPKSKKFKAYSKQELFYLQYNQIRISPLGQFLFVLSTADSKLIFKNKKAQINLRVKSKFYTDDLAKNVIKKFKPPTENFKIYQVEIDLDGSIYILGRTQKFIQKNILSREETYGKFNLQIIKYNPNNGDYNSELIENDTYFHNVKMIINDDIYVVGTGETETTNQTVLSYQVYNSDLIRQYKYFDTLKAKFVDDLNSENEKHMLDYYNKKAYGAKPIHYPLLNFEFISVDLLDNGNLVLVMEKNMYDYPFIKTSNSSSGSVNSYPYKRGDLLIFSLSKNGLSWQKTISKTQKSLNANNSKLGAFVHVDGTNIHLYYNVEGEIEGGFIADKSKKAVIKHIILDNNGEIKANNYYTLGKKKRLYLNQASCFEPYPGKVIFKAENEKQVAFGIYEY